LIIMLATNMRQDLEWIFRDFGGKLMGSYHMKRNVCLRRFLKLPNSMIRYITQNCYFMSSMDDAWAFTFTGNDLKDHHLNFPFR